MRRVIQYFSGVALLACLALGASAQDIHPTTENLSPDSFPKRPYSPPRWAKISDPGVLVVVK